MNEKQKRFAEEYLIDLNGAQAAIRAGYSEATARQQASDLLTNPDVQAYITEMNAERSNKTKIDASWLLTRLANEAEADVADIYDADGKLLPVRQWPLIWRKGLVAGLDVAEERDPETGEVVAVVRKVKVSDRIKRLELIGKHINVNAFQENVKVTGLDGLADRLARAASRLKGEAE